MNMFELEELKQMRMDLVLTIKKALDKIEDRISHGQFDLAKDKMAQAEIIVKAIEDSK
jgi:hypothetical protein